MTSQKKTERLFVWPDFLAVLLCFVFYIFWLNLLWQKFQLFGYYDWDLALYAQATWALSHGEFYSSLFATNFLTNHAEYIAFFIAPLYGLFPHPFTLVICKILSVTLGSFILYLIAKRSVGPAIALGIMALYQLHPANLFMLIYEFHFENLAIVFLLLTYYFFQTRKFTLFAISAVLAALVKENISLLVFMFGIYAFFTRREEGRKWVITPLLVGGGIFILSMFIITPYLRAQEGLSSANQYLYLYWQTSSDASWLDKIRYNMWTNWQNFTSPNNLDFMKDLFGPFNILPFLSPHVLLLGAPMMLQTFLSPAAQMHSFFYHYAATTLIFFFLASIHSLQFLKTKSWLRAYNFMIIIGCISYLAQISVYLPEFNRRVADWADRMDPIRTAMINRIPPEEKLIASFDFLAPLANRKELYSFHSLWQNYQTFNNGKAFTLPDTVKVALIDWRCPWLWGDLLISRRVQSRQYLERINHFYFSYPWQVRQAVDDIILMERRGTSGLPLVENLPSDAIIREIDAKISNNLTLANLKAGALTNGVLPLEFTWEATEEISDYLFVIIKIFKDDKLILLRKHPIGYTFNATPLWKKGQCVREYYYLLWPQQLKTDHYQIAISVENQNTKQLETLYFKDQIEKELKLINLEIPMEVK